MNLIKIELLLKVKYYDKWLEVFSEQVEENGTIAERPNRTIYGIIKPKDLDKWTDIDRTAAINILQRELEKLLLNITI